MMIRSHWCVLARSLIAAGATAMLFSAPLAAQKASPSLQPGEYVTEGGWGSMTLKAGKHGSLLFSIEAVGANGHTCSLEGELQDGRAKLEGVDEKEPCVVTMALTAEGIKVEGGDACRAYCGARARFEGVYFLPPPACAANAVASTRKTFKKLYDAKQFGEARGKLEPLLKDCARTLDWIEIGRIRNDLAVTLHKLGDLSGCLAVLEPLAGDAKLSDEEVREKLPPMDGEMYLPVVRAARTNLKLCRER